MATISENEKEILEFWSKQKIYEKSRKKNAKGRKFYMMDGPPYASGDIHLGTALNKCLKDISMRTKRMQGDDVFDKAGYDTHGVPIEFQVEKEIGSKSKQDIEKFGVDKFVKRCREFATQYIRKMNSEFKALGVWMDFENPYLTLSDEYIEAVWTAFKEADKKALLYLGKYPVHVCTRCETAVAYNEIEYGKQKDISIFVKFPLKKQKNKYLIIWTTTAWTLPGNTGVMVAPNIVYQEIETTEGERWFIAKALVPKLMSVLEKGFTIKSELKGKQMDGWEYENPLAENLNLHVKNGYKVVLSARYVTTEEGTGLVHCAPGHGKEDYEVGKEYKLDAPCPVDINGLLTKEAGKYAGKKAREVDKEIISDLEKKGMLVHKMEYIHDYPLCWRDKTPLLMLSRPQWFFKISEIQKKLIAENEKTNWVPSYMKLRMKAWLEGIGDWPVSRQRYWGIPLPIWLNEKTGEKIVVGSIEELKKLSKESKIEMHKPGIDKVVIKTSSGEFRRVSEVLDVWFDSGVSSWAALGYPKNTALFKKYWPADLNIEGKDQFRGWWNSQMLLSQIAFNRKPFENVIVHGMILDLSKKKMSKSKGNATTPQEIVEKFGRDAMRYYFAKLSKGEDFSFDESMMKEVQRIFTMLSNINNFVGQISVEKSKLELEDKWILSVYNKFVDETIRSFNSYEYPKAVEKIEDFIINQLSRKYIQMIRERAGESYQFLNEIRIGLLKLLAPIIPFITEKIWQSLREKAIVKEESVHLSEFPKADKKKINEKLEKEFGIAMSVIELGLAERDKAKIGLRWPLASAEISISNELNKELLGIIARQLNVKKVNVKKTKESQVKVKLELKITPELEAEGYAREIARKVQSERKNAGLRKGQLIELTISCNNELKKMLQTNIEFLKERTNSKKIEFTDGKMPEKAIVFTAKENKISFFFRNL